MGNVFLKLNKDALYSVAGLVLAFVAVLSAPFWESVILGLSLVNVFDWTVLRVFGVSFASTYLLLAPYLLFVVFLAVSAYFGIKVIRNTETGVRHGRWLAVVSATTSAFLLVVAFVVFLGWF